MIIQNKLQKLFLSFIGFLLISLFLWLRLVRYIFESKALVVLPFFLIKGMIIFFVFFYSYALYTMLTLLILKNNKYLLLQQLKKVWLFENFILYFTLIRESPKTFYTTIIFPRVPVVFLIEKPLFNLVKLFANKPKDFLYLFFKTLPRIMVSTLFLLSIFQIRPTTDFVFALFLLILPLFYNCYFYITKHFCDENIPYFKDHLNIKKSNKEGVLNVEFADAIPDYPDAKDIIIYKNNQALLNWFISNYNIYTNIRNFLIRLQGVEDKYKTYENLYVYSCYLMGWSYILYHSL